VFVIALLGIAWGYWSLTWLVFAVVLFILGMRHPSIQDRTQIGPGRTKLGLLGLVIFLLSFTFVPMRISNGF
jgi:hypothetical protein